jgi:uncharacterized protein YjbI with pentapeptide repeats
MQSEDNKIMLKLYFKKTAFFYAIFLAFFLTFTQANANDSGKKEAAETGKNKEEAQLNASKLTELEVAKYIDETRQKYGFGYLIDVVGKFRRKASITQIAYGNTVQVLDLSYGNYEQFDFQNCKLTMSVWRGVKADGAIFHGADLSSANFENASFVGANFNRANLSNANFTKALITGASFEGANLFKANFAEATGLDEPTLKALQKQTPIFRQLPQLPVAAE